LLEIRVLRGIIVALSISATPLAHAQDLRLAFDVASIKVHGQSAYIPLQCSHGRFVSAGLSFLFIIGWAYELNASQLADLEKQLQPWANQLAYNIEAKSEKDVTLSQCRDMMKTLLADRINLSFHFVVKEGKVYHLIIAPQGHRMQKVSDTETVPGLNIVRDGLPLQALPGMSLRPGSSMTDFADRLSGYVSLVPVIDKTGLQGMYKINLKFSSRLVADQSFSDPDIFTAIQIQLGLKLEEHKGPVSSFIVDHIDRPEPN